MHYANGRAASVGDMVVGRTYNTGIVVAGQLQSVTPGLDACNCTVVAAGGYADYGQLDHLLHVDDCTERYFILDGQSHAHTSDRIDHYDLARLSGKNPEFVDFYCLDTDTHCSIGDALTLKQFTRIQSRMREDG